MGVSIFHATRNYTGVREHKVEGYDSFDKLPKRITIVSDLGSTIYTKRALTQYFDKDEVHATRESANNEYISHCNAVISEAQKAIALINSAPQK